MKTPFDELRTLFSITYPPPIPPEINNIVNSFVTVLRALYIQQVESADILLHSRTIPLTDEIAEKINNAHTLCRLSYFQLIEQINIFGRIFIRKYKLSPLPLYYRIYFFRNKIVEHWDDYIRTTPPQTVQMSSAGQSITVMIPYIMGSGVLPDRREQTRNELIRLLGKYGVALSIDDRDWYGDYSKKVFIALETIDPELRQGKIKEDVVDALFDYMFPTPITDVETYAEELASYLRKIIP